MNKKIDFAGIFTVEHANPNGDPLNGNRPRETYEGLGEVSDVCLKRKIRNRLQDMGECIFVQSEDRCDDGYTSLKERKEAVPELKKEKDKDKFKKKACEQWFDVRAFGQVFAFKGDDLSVGVRGPVTIQPAFTVVPVNSVTIQITKSVNSVKAEKKSSDTMGSKHRIDFGVYVFYGSINCQLAEGTGFSDADAEKIKEALITLFENDASSARPEGSMEMQKVYWWQHDCKAGQYSSAKVHHSLKVSLKDGVDSPGTSINDYNIELKELPGLKVEVIEGK